MIVLVSIDGVRGDAMDAADCPNLRAFRSRALWTMQAQSVMPSITLPCHMSIFHSVPPTRHGIVSNTYTPMARPLPGIIETAFQAGKKCAMFYNWEPLRNLSQPERVVHSLFQHHFYKPDADIKLAHEAARALRSQPIDFAFVYFGMTDEMGHVHGWMQRGYLDQLALADRAFGVLMDSLPSDTSVLMVSDHGGHERTHGTDSPEDMNVPFMLAGPNIAAGRELQERVSLLDVAPTIAHLLNIAPPREWEGRNIAGGG
jgi:predicted AlkP superfamily pyrophosphatase or phosphodiesterase